DITVAHETPSQRASEATERASSPTARVHSRPARADSTRRSGSSSECSVQVWTGQSGSGQENRRLDQTSRTRRSKAGRSLMITRSRSLVLAITPQLGHPAALRIVSMPTSSSSPSSVTASTRNPRSPNKASSNSVPSPIVRGPPVLSVVEQPREWRRPWPRRWIPIGARLVVHAPQFIEKSPISDKQQHASERRDRNPPQSMRPVIPPQPRPTVGRHSLESPFGIAPPRAPPPSESSDCREGPPYSREHRATPT